MKSKKFFAFVGGVSIVLILAALPFIEAHGAPAAKPAATKELVIGAAYGMTGPWISYSIPHGKCYQLQAKRINSQGGITVGGEKYLIKLVSVDAKGTAEGGRAAVERLISLHGARFIAGPTLSSGSVAALPLIVQNKVINMSPVTTQKVLTPECPYYFKAHFPGSLVARVYPEFLAERYPSISRIALVMPDDDAGYSNAEYIKAGVAEVNKKQAGRLEIVFEDRYPKGTEDHTPILTAALAKNPHVIDLDSGAPEEMSIIVKEARGLGYKGWFTSGGGFTLERLNEIAGKDFAYNIIHTSFDINNPIEPYIPAGQEQKWEQFRKVFGDWAWLASAWRAEYGEEMSGVVIYANDILPVMLSGIIAANSLDTDKVVKALEEMKYVPTYFGMGTWMGKKTWGINHQIRRPVPLYEIKYGKQFPIKPSVLPPYYP
jgi:branched-chain amino acid transport system substrate-binding protein